MSWINKVKQCLLFSTLLFACQSPDHPAAKPELIVVYPTALREKAGEKSPELAQLPVGTALTDAKKVSPFLSAITLNDTLREEPWFLVSTADGRQGWVFGGAVDRAGPTPGAAQGRWRLEKRFEAWFGPVLAQQWLEWLDAPAATTDTAMATWLRSGLHLRDTLNLLIARNVTPGAGPVAPDLFWLRSMTPYFLIQQIAGGSQYYLFADYRAWVLPAQRTSGRQDDLFTQTCIEAFPVDSIESALPAWVFPVSAEASYSNLGMGLHLNMLKSIDRAMQAGNLFQPELTALKDKVLADILDKDRAFWQPQAKILRELRDIEKTSLHCLDGQDRSALAARATMFEAPEANGLRLNLRSGQ